MRRLFRFRGIVAVRFLLILLCLVAAQPAYAAMPRSCQQALDAPAADSGDETTSAGNIFGDLVYEIDGSTLKSPQQMRAALKSKPANRNALINGGDFGGWDFAKAQLPLDGVCFYEGIMKGSKWDGGAFAGIGLVLVDLEGATFRNAKLDDVLLREAKLKDVTMKGTSLQRGRLDGGWAGSLENWDLSGANMRDFKFDCGITVGDGCPLDRDGVKFFGADLTGADISTYNYWGGADYTHAVLNRTKVSPRQVSQLVGALVAGPVILVGGEASISLSPAELAELQGQYASTAKLADQPSFDCAKAGSDVEKLICGEYESEIRRQDRQMAELFAMLRPKNPAIVTEQKKWLTVRNACKDRDCLQDAYDKRVGAMLTMLGEPEPLKPGEDALYVYDNDELASPASFRESALYAKITPVLVGASMGEVLLSRNKDGSYDIMGESVGGNAHLCSVGGEGLRYNPKTGWFSGPNDDDPKKLAAVFRLFGDQIEFPGNGHPDEEEFPGSESYASCGARALLSTMTRIDVSKEELAKWRAIFEGNGS